MPSEQRNSAVEAGSRTAVLEFDKVKADVLNVVPPQRAGDIAAKSGIKLISNRWVDIDWLTSVNTPGVRVDTPGVQVANQHAKVDCRGYPQPAGGQRCCDGVVMNLLQLVDSKERHSSVRPNTCGQEDRMPVQGLAAYPRQRMNWKANTAVLGQEHLG